jgi:hypothetical protein
VRSSTIVAGVIGLAIVGALVGGGLYLTRNNRVELKGEVLKVRSAAIDNDNTIAVIDFRVTNPFNNQFVVKNIDVFLDTKDAKQVDSAIFAETDSRRMFDYYKVLGKKYNPTLLTRDKIEPGQSVDRMIAVRFTVPDAQVGNRKDVRLVIEDLDGQKCEIVERAAP